ncbi:MAG TPA: hypothetical protein PK185_02445 [Cyclobacteriaceae bacterium]|nr:hypothetical protein [Cyclobacteriaceae bacterium]
MKNKNPMLVALIALTLQFGIASAQQDLTKGSLIELRGHVNCLVPERGVLPDVVIFNLNKNWGTLTNAEGNFSIRMAASDTILLSTPLHQDYKYYLNDLKTMEDHTIEITMQPDAIWLETVNVLGYLRIENFKNEILNLDSEVDNPEVITPILDKYTKQRETGDGSFEIKGPINYLGSKFSKYARIKRQIKKGNRD